MSALQTELERLYGAVADAGTQGTAATTRVLVLELSRPADWQALSAVWRGVQADMELPAPAIAVNGVDGYQLWFSLTEPVTVEQGQAFLERLRARYLAAVPRARIRLLPTLEEAPASLTVHVPAQQAPHGYWSAFLAPDLATLFADEPWLDREPSAEAQAGVLAGLQSIKPAAWAAVLPPVRSAPAQAMSVAAGDADGVAQTYALQPRRFLMDVMNNPAIDMHLRIEAAKALLPYCSD